MKRQTLQIGSALLATTALSTSAIAGTIVNASDTAQGTTLTAKSLSAQVFGATTPENVTLGPVSLNLDFANALTTTFDVEIESTNSDFTGTVTLEVYAESGTTLENQVSFGGCTVQVLTERILIEDCVNATIACRIDLIQLSGIAFNEANGLATVGSSIALSGIVKGASGGNTFETITSANIVTSATGLTAAATAATGASISNTAVPPFSSLSGGDNYTLGVVTTTTTGTLATDLATTISIDTNLTASMEITVTHGVLTDAATDDITITGSATGGSVATSVTASNFNGNIASFNFSANGDILGSFDIQVNFDGTTAISNWTAGTVGVVFSPGSLNLVAPPGATGTLAALTRGGFSTQINTVQSSAGTGSTVFQSLIRLVNNGSVAGPVNIVVRDDADGSSYGTYTTATIAPNASLQVNMPTIETALGITASGQYQLGLSGPIDGYAQHVMFNSVDNHFVDLSGFRAANP